MSYWLDKRDAFVREWAEELAPVVGRSVDELRARGLGATDFRNRAVEVEFQDGSRARFEYAFFVESKAKRAIAIFTEHCGYFDVDDYETVRYADSLPLTDE